MPLIIPIFIPHQGCPHACIFCNQYKISGQEKHSPVTPSGVQETILLWLNRNPTKAAKDVQVAFYGGSFTGLPLFRQQELLEAVNPFLKSNRVQSIRLSTRPDYIQGETVDFLKEYEVSTVELGVQSLDDSVLEASCRGHTAAHVYKSVDLLRQGGMQTGLQLMLGLPGQSNRSIRETVKEAAALKPDFVRIYPVLVVKESRLNRMFSRGEYNPLSLDKAIVQAAWMKKYFDVSGIKVVRMGLQPSPELEENLVAGPYHPAFGELVNSRIMLQKTRKALQGVRNNNRQLLSISDRDVSIFRGINSRNIERIKQLGLAERFVLVTDKNQPRFTLRKISEKNRQAIHVKCQ